MPNFKRTRNKSEMTTAVPPPVTQKAISKTRRSTSVSVKPEPEPEPEPEPKPWEIGDKVKPKRMPGDTFYTIVNDAGDGVNWMMKVGRRIGDYCESIPKINETNGTWEYWKEGHAAALKKRYKRKSKSKRRKSKRRKSKRRKSKRRKSKPL